MKKLLLLLVVMVAALSVGASVSRAAVTPDTLPGGGNGGGCTAYGELVNASPSYMEGYGAVDCPDSPGARVSINVCLQQYGVTGWYAMDCVANQGWGGVSATVIQNCKYTTAEVEIREEGFAEAVLPDGTVLNSVAYSPVAFTHCLL